MRVEDLAKLVFWTVVGKGEQEDEEEEWEGANRTDDFSIFRVVEV